MTRDKLYEISLEEWSKSNGYLLANITMGMGKTRLGLKINDSFTKGAKLIITHSVVSQDSTWFSESVKWKLSLDRTDFVYLESVSKLDKFYDLIILDECHKILPSVFEWLKLQFHKGSKLLFLTGTLPDDKDKMTMLNWFNLKSINYTFMQALEDGNANNITFNIVYCNQENTIKKYSVPMRRGLFTEREAYIQICSKIECAKTEKLRQLAIQERMWFLYKSETKIKVAIYLRNHFESKNLRYIIFAPTKAIAKSLSDKIYYSGSTDKYYNMFKNEEINHLVTVEQLKTGENISNLRYGIILQNNSKKHNFEQLGGRFTRLGDNTEKSEVYIIVLKETMDFSWLSNSCINVPKSYFKEYEISNEKLNSIIWPIE